MLSVFYSCVINPMKLGAKVWKAYASCLKSKVGLQEYLGFARA